MNYKKFFAAFALLMSFQFAYPQDGIPVYADYFADNLYLLHPSMAGAASSGQIRLTARQQWFDQQNAPNLQTLAVNMRLGESSGIGAIAFNDQNGFHSQVGMYLTYAHHLLFSRSEVDLNQLSFGMTAGIVQSRLDETNFDLTDFDPVIAGIIQSTSYFNVDVGLSYNLMELSAHFTVKNLIFQNRNLYTEDFESNNQRRYLFSTAYTIGGRFRNNWYYEPSILVQYVERTEEAGLDVNFKAFRNMDFGKVWGGISYRTSFDGAEYLDGVSLENQRLQYISPVVGIHFNDFMFAYTYSHQIGNIKFTNGGFHQITVGYDFLKRKEAYDCNCPAIN